MIWAAKKFLVVFYSCLSVTMALEIVPIVSDFPEKDIQGEIHASSETSSTHEESSLIKEKQFSLSGILLFSGKDTVSSLIRNLTYDKHHKGPRWSHVGLLLQDQEGVSYCFESTGSYEQIMHHRFLPQVQLNLFEDVKQAYKGNIALREISFEAGAKDEPSLVTALTAEFLGRPYEKDISSLLFALHKRNRKNNLESFFCSELVAEFLQRLELLDNSINESNFLPCDFATNNPTPLPLINITLGPEKDLKNIFNSEKTKRTLPCTIL